MAFLFQRASEHISRNLILESWTGGENRHKSSVLMMASHTNHSHERIIYSSSREYNNFYTVHPEDNRTVMALYCITQDWKWDYEYVVKVLTFVLVVWLYGVPSLGQTEMQLSEQTVRWIAMYFYTYFSDPQPINTTDLCDPLTLSLAHLCHDVFDLLNLQFFSFASVHSYFAFSKH